MKHNYEEYIELILEMDIFGIDLDRDFRKLVLDNKDRRNLNLIRDYFFDRKLINDLRDILLNEEKFDTERITLILEKLVEIYPLSKNLLDAIIYKNNNREIEKKLLAKFSYKNNPFVKGMKTYISNINNEYSNGKEEIKDLENKVNQIEVENNKIIKLEEKLKEVEEVNKQYDSKIKERKDLENKIEELKKAIQIAFEDALVQKLMPKLRGLDINGEIREECLNKIREKISTYANGIVSVRQLFYRILVYLHQSTINVYASFAC